MMYNITTNIFICTCSLYSESDFSLYIQQNIIYGTFGIFSGKKLNKTDTVKKCQDVSHNINLYKLDVLLNNEVKVIFRHIGT